MFFITVEHARDEETGQLHGCRLKLQPLLENSTASAAIYGELWHRLRRDNVFSCQLDETQNVFDASLYFRSFSVPNCDTIDAAIILNNAKVDGFKLCHNDAEATITEWLHRMDSLLIELLQHPVFAPRLEELSDQFAAASSARAANAELKDILKRYCREQGLYVDASDISTARAQLKERRRQIFQAGVEAGQIQIPRRGHRKRPR